MVSTSLGLVVDFLVTYTELTPEDIVLDDVIAANPNFKGFPKFKTLVLTVRDVLESCGNVDTDEDVQDALCLAAEEVGRIVLPDLDLGCAPGFTPATPNPPPPTPPDPCAGNTGPSITIADKSINAGDSLSYAPGNVGYTAGDDGVTGAPIYTLSNEPEGMSIDPATGTITFATDCGEGDVYEAIEVTITDACGLVASDTFTLTVVECGFTVTLLVDPAGTGITSGSGPYNVGDTVNISATANAGYTFVNWTDDDDSNALVSTNASYNFTMPAANVNYTANFAELGVLHPIMSSFTVDPGQERIRLNLRDVLGNKVTDLSEDKNDWAVTLAVTGGDPTIVSVQYGTPAYDFEIIVVNIPTGTQLKDVTVTYKGYDEDVIIIM